MHKFKVIRKNWEFQKIIDSKKQIVSKNLIFYYQPQGFFEIGISIPKKFANSVLRNYFKRQIKSIIHELIIDDFLLPKVKCVLITRKTFLNLSFMQKKEKITKLLEELNRNAK
ncbi:ribonuclease P protein component [Mesomycoplasma bovoculi]|uniref:Ribonuclease P protein component n=1 Tax=Mesomycoplasma bovoculi M165/69 TaxID=743966 RepID=W5UTN4_9BACT|nr:ribonuclease P protein component [Mesomycoplasma bovoculi]AHH45594.1 ribonuclease P protein component [Mesomycoplasma bovoculi M165/69]